MTGSITLMIEIVHRRLKMSKPFKETVEERAKRDPEFRKELEKEKLATKILEQGMN